MYFLWSNKSIATEIQIIKPDVDNIAKIIGVTNFNIMKDNTISQMNG